MASLATISVASKQAPNTVDYSTPPRRQVRAFLKQSVFAPEPVNYGVEGGSSSLTGLSMVHFSSLRGRADLLLFPLHFAVSLERLIGLYKLTHETD